MPQQTVTTLSRDSIAQFRSWCSESGKSENTSKAYSSDLMEFLRAVDPTGSPIHLEEMEELATSWLNLTRPKVAASTTQRRVVSLKTFSRWAGLENFLADYVTPRVRESHRTAIPGGIESVRKMIAQAKTHESRTLVALIGLAGAQINEALALKVKHINLETKIASIPGMRHRRVPISPEAWDAMAETIALKILDPNRYLVEYGDRTARKVVTDMARDANLSMKVSTNNLRLVFVEAVAYKSGDEKTAQAILGLGITEGNLDLMREAVDFR